MNISYNWLKDYLTTDMSPDEIATALTSIGLETGAVRLFETIKGGMEGLVVGEVLTCTKHPNSDHLSLTTVNIGNGKPVQMVCGAPNVAAGQKVIIAPIGTVLYDGDNAVKIKKGKIRGEESHGMICAEDEIGLSNDHSGIIVLPNETPVGMPAKTYYNITRDYVFEVDITPNHVESTSHIGVARELAAWMKQNGKPFTLKKDFHTDAPFEALSADRQGGRGMLKSARANTITVEIENTEACLRYSGVTIRNVTVKESPAWLKNRLITIGLRPINNIVDITNYVLHEMGQPLHAFDADKIKGNKIVVRTMPDGTKFVSLDGVERTLTDQDLMICNAEEPMAFGGIFGGLHSGVTEQTTEVFLESACFNPSWVRRTARRFSFNTDASFRFERGLDPNQTIFALKRAAVLMQEIAGGEITEPLQDVYPLIMEPYPVSLTYKRIHSLTGKAIPAETIKSILTSLDITIVAETSEGLSIKVPPYRFDVRRDADVIEEILRIYGYNNVEINDRLNATLSYQTPTDISYKLENIISEQLCGAGFNEIINNSLTRLTFYDDLLTYPAANCVLLKNPLSADLNAMRQTLLFGGLQSIAFNVNHKNKNNRFFEFGNCYSRNVENTNKKDILSEYQENYRLGLWITGKRIENNWAHPDEDASVYELKAHIENIFHRVGIRVDKLIYNSLACDIFSTGMTITSKQGYTLGTFGVIHKNILKKTDVENEVFFAELSWDTMLKLAQKESVTFCEIPRFPEVKRDLALLADKNVLFDDIRKIAFESEPAILKKITLFDVYEGKNLPPDKKSYAVSFYLQDSDKTLTDNQIEAIMSKMEKNIADRLGIQIRK